MTAHPRDVAGQALPAGLIGPNAVTRLAEALASSPADRDAVFARAGLSRYLAAPPEAMVDDEDVARLHRSMRELVGLDRAARVSRKAGRLTGDYLLAHRIPKVAQAILRVLPARLAARILLKAIARHAWTFAGRGTFACDMGPPIVLRLAGAPVCRDTTADRPLCDYYAATFERVFRAMLGPAVTVTETQCQASGAPACLFEVDLAHR